MEKPERIYSRLAIPAWTRRQSFLQFEAAGGENEADGIQVDIWPSQLGRNSMLEQVIGFLMQGFHLGDSWRLVPRMPCGLTAHFLCRRQRPGSRTAVKLQVPCREASMDSLKSPETTTILRSVMRADSGGFPTACEVITQAGGQRAWMRSSSMDTHQPILGAEVQAVPQRPVYDPRVRAPLTVRRKIR